MAFAQGSVVFENQAGLVQQWTSNASSLGGRVNALLRLRFAQANDGRAPAPVLRMVQGKGANLRMLRED